MTRILVTGSRHWTSWSEMEKALTSALTSLDEKPAPFTLVNGGAFGADSMANHIWRKWGLPTEQHKADWKRYGKAAGPVRNNHMVSLGADLCLAFFVGIPDSRKAEYDANPFAINKGTAQCVASAKDAGIPVQSFTLTLTEAGFDTLMAQHLAKKQAAIANEQNQLALASPVSL